VARLAAGPRSALGVHAGAAARVRPWAYATAYEIALVHHPSSAHGLSSMGRHLDWSDDELVDFYAPLFAATGEDFRPSGWLRRARVASSMASGLRFGPATGGGITTVVAKRCRHDSHRSRSGVATHKVGSSHPGMRGGSDGTNAYHGADARTP
jgi:hypothetical protein